MKRQEASDTLEYSGKDWRYAVSATFVRGSSSASRRRFEKVHDLSAMARMLYIYLASFISPESPVAFPGLKLMKFDLGLNESTIKKYRRELEEAGFLIRKQSHTRGRFGSNRYRLTEPSSVKSSPAEKRSTKKSSTVEPPSKSTQSAKSSQSLEERKPGREKSAPDGTPSHPVDSLPAAVEARATPEQRAEALISFWTNWYHKFYGHSLFVDGTQRKKVFKFMLEYPDITVREVLALAFRTWRSAEDIADDEASRKHYWHIAERSKLPGDFISSLTQITCDLKWDLGNEPDDKIEKSFQRMVERIQQKSEESSEEAE